MFHQLALLAVPDFQLVEPGNELASMISDACLKAGIALNDGDVVVIWDRATGAASPAPEYPDVLGQDGRRWRAHLSAERSQ